jgi:hypothetical protein
MLLKIQILQIMAGLAKHWKQTKKKIAQAVPQNQYNMKYFFTLLVLLSTHLNAQKSLSFDKLIFNVKTNG